MEDWLHGLAAHGRSRTSACRTFWQHGTSSRTSFPHTAPWNLPAQEIEELQRHEDDQEIIRRYWMPVIGAIPLCHEGCALRDWLVVTGPEAGHVWHDATADFEGWRPVMDSRGVRATFAAWYSDWLGAALAKLGTS